VHLEGFDDTGSLTVLEDIDEAAFSDMIGRGVGPVATDVASAWRLWNDTFPRPGTAGVDEVHFELKPSGFRLGAIHVNVEHPVMLAVPLTKQTNNL